MKMEEESDVHFLNAVMESLAQAGFSPGVSKQKSYYYRTSMFALPRPPLGTLILSCIETSITVLSTYRLFTIWFTLLLSCMSIEEFGKACNCMHRANIAAPLGST